MAYEMVSRADASSAVELYLDNKGAVNTADSGQDGTYKRYARRDDPDIAATIGRAVKRRRETGREPIKVEWIRGHSDTKMAKEDITEHHERQQLVDKLTKVGSGEQPICTLQTAGEMRVLFNEHELETNATTHELTLPLRKHIGSTLKTDRALEHGRRRETRHYGMRNGQRAGFMIHACLSCHHQGTFPCKLVHHLLPDGPTLSMRTSGQRMARCVCGKDVGSTEHIFVSCDNAVLREVRKAWVDEIEEIIYSYMGEGAHDLVTELWKAGNDGTIEGAQQAEVEKYRGAWGDAVAKDVTGPSSSDDDSDDDDDESSSSGADRSEYKIRTGVDGEEEDAEEDWEHILYHGDPTHPRTRQRARRCLKSAIEENHTVSEFWYQLWHQYIPPLLAISMGIQSPEQLAKLMARLSEARDQYTRRLWKEYTRLAHAPDSHTTRQQVEKKLEKWDELKAEIGTLTNRSQKPMPTSDTIRQKQWLPKRVGRELDAWKRVLQAWRMRHGKTQRRIDQYFTAPGRARRPAATGQRDNSQGQRGGGGYCPGEGHYSDDDGAVAEGLANTTEVDARGVGPAGRQGTHAEEAGHTGDESKSHDETAVSDGGIDSDDEAEAASAATAAHTGVRAKGAAPAATRESTPHGNTRKRAFTGGSATGKTEAGAGATTSQATATKKQATLQGCWGQRAQGRGVGRGGGGSAGRAQGHGAAANTGTYGQGRGRGNGTVVREGGGVKRRREGGSSDDDPG